MLTHHKLNVYVKALAFFAVADRWLRNWSNRHAVADQLGRASESIVLNLAEGSRLREPSRKAQALDCALGSALECAACIDIAAVKELLERSEVEKQKHGLWEITVMLISLRKSWLTREIREDSPEYQVRQTTRESVQPFHHERLDVYQTGLAFMRWFTAQPGGRELTHRLVRRLDHAATGMLLNIAEGNGRYAQLDHARFLAMAATATVKTSTYLDLWEQTARPNALEAEPGQEFLRRIMAMLEKMVAS